jgi:hypothetical protein
MPTILTVRGTITGNRAEQRSGGGIDSWGFSRPLIRDCIIAGNSAPRGGGVYHDKTVATYANCTIVGNSASYDGGGITAMDWADVTAVNCIVWGNTSPAGDQISVALEDSAVSVRFCDIQGGPNAIPVAQYSELTWGEGNIDADPLFVDPNGPDGDPNTWQDNDYHLTDASPCRNAGDPNGLYAAQTDIDGEPRVAGGRVDIGADEAKYRLFQCGGGAGGGAAVLAVLCLWAIRRRIW